MITNYLTYVVGVTLTLVILMPPGLQASVKPNVVFVLMDNFG